MSVSKYVCGLYVKNIKIFTRLLETTTVFSSSKHCCQSFTKATRATGLPTKQGLPAKTKEDEESISLKDDIIINPQVKTPEEARETLRYQRIKKALHGQFKILKDQAAKKKELEHEYEIGCRHLANMMGADYATFQQKDVDKAIEYLMPSGLFEPLARPMMKPPSEMFKEVKDFNDIDESGRPLNTFYYTGRGEFYTIFYNISQVLKDMNEYEDKMIARGFVKPPPETKIFLDDSEWISFGDMKKALTDKNLPEHEYNYLIQSLERLVQHPYSFRFKDFIHKYRKPKIGFQKGVTIKPVTVGEDGIPYVQAIGARKRTLAEVTVKGKGTGEISINGRDISYFPLKQDREQLLFPLKFSGLLNQVDVEVALTGEGGHTAEAGAIRHGLSQALASFVDSQLVEKMRLEKHKSKLGYDVEERKLLILSLKKSYDLSSNTYVLLRRSNWKRHAGLMQRDVRTREREKYGQKGARAKFKWVKR